MKKSKLVRRVVSSLLALTLCLSFVMPTLGAMDEGADGLSVTTQTETGTEDGEGTTTEYGTTESTDSTEPSEEASTFSAEARDAGTEALDEEEFTSTRLVVLTSDPSVIDASEDVIARYNDLYIIQYENATQAMNAYAYYLDTAEAVEPDMTLEAADGEGLTGEEADIEVTEGNNPLAILEEATAPEDQTTPLTEGEGVEEQEEPVIALLDTGAALSDNVIAQVSMIGDEMVSGRLQHGENMVQAILSQNPDARILSVRVLDDDGLGTVSSIVAGMEYAISMDVDYINLSLYAKSTLATSVVKEEIKKATEAGIVVVGAAGNNSDDVAGYIPGSVEEAYIIGAADELGNPLASSNYGATVDYFVAAGSTSEAAAIFTGYVSANGLDALPADGLIFANGETGSEDGEEDMTLSAAPEEILSKLDPAYIEYDPETTMGWGAVANMALKKTYVEDEYATTLEGFYDRDTYAENQEGYIITVDTTLNLYDVNNDSIYVVGVLNEGGEDIRDIEFARRNDNAEMLENEHYDYETGLVYINKADLFSIDHENELFIPNDVQAQVLISSTKDVIPDLIDAGAIPNLMDDRFSTADLAGNEGPAPTDLLGQLVGSLVEGDAFQFTVGRVGADSISGETINYLYAVGSRDDAYKNAFYQGVRDGNIAAAQAEWNRLYNDNLMRYAGYYTGDTPRYAAYRIELGGGNITNMAGNQTMINWFQQLINMNRTIDLECAEIRNPATGSTRNMDFTARVIEIGNHNGYDYAVVGIAANEALRDGSVRQVFAGTYIITYTPPTTEPDPVTASVEVHKQSSVGNTPLSGAEFTLERWDWDSRTWIYIDRKTTGSNGRADFSFQAVLGSKDIFRVYESKAPEGYTKSDQILYFPITQDGQHYNRGFVHYDPNVGTWDSATTPTMWTDTPYTANINVNKVNSQTGGKLQGATFTLYQWNGSSWASTGKTAVTNSNGVATFSNVQYTQANKGFYMVRETTAPSGFQLAKNQDRYVRITANGQTYTAGYTTCNPAANTIGGWTDNAVKNEPNYGYIEIYKKSSNTSLSDGNPCYSYKGAVYGIYSNSACTTRVSTMTTNGDGYAKSGQLVPGTYYVKEITAPPGFEKSDQVYPITVGNGQTVRETVYDAPANDPMTITLTKAQETPDSHWPDMSGTQFTIRYYAGQYSSVNSLPSTPTRTWVIETKAVTNNGRTVYMAQLSDTYKVSGDDFYYDDGHITIPLGTVTVEETRSAFGYTLEGGWLRDSDGNSVSSNGGVILLNVTQNSQGLAYLNGGNYYTKEDSFQYASITLMKEDETGNPLEGAVFNLEIQNANGGWDQVRTGTSDGNGQVVFDELVFGTYRISELETENGYTLLAEPIIVELPYSSEDGYTDADPTFTRDGVNYYCDIQYTITNTPTFSLPMTGASGISPIPVIGGGLMAASAILFFMERRRRRVTY